MGITHCVKSVRIHSYSGWHFLTFRLNTERYRVSLRIQFKWGKMRARITPTTGTFHIMAGIPDTVENNKLEENVAQVLKKVDVNVLNKECHIS